MEHLNKDQQQAMHNALKRSGKIIRSTKMTTDKTTALIEALNYIVSHAWVANTPTAHKWINEFVDVAKEALAAFEQPVVREMTVDEVAEIICGAIFKDPNELVYESRRSEKKIPLWHTYIKEAKALVKLGTIRVVEDK